MTSVHVRLLSADSSVMAVDVAARTSVAGVVPLPDDATNMPSRTLLVASSHPPSQVDRTIDYAVSRYENLLRRLAD